MEGAVATRSIENALFLRCNALFAFAVDQRKTVLDLLSSSLVHISCYFTLFR